MILARLTSYYRSKDTENYIEYRLFPPRRMIKIVSIYHSGQVGRFLARFCEIGLQVLDSDRLGSNSGTRASIFRSKQPITSSLQFPVVKLFENSSGRNFNRHARPDKILVNRVKNNTKRIKEMLRYLLHSNLDRLGLKPLFDAHWVMVSAK
jgi:hypothetical protein